MASEKITALVEQVKELTVLELSELVHTLEEVFGVSAAAAAVYAHTYVNVAFLGKYCRRNSARVNKRRDRPAVLNTYRRIV